MNGTFVTGRKPGCQTLANLTKRATEILDNPNGFFISAVFMVLLGVALIAYFRWKKWI